MYEVLWAFKDLQDDEYRYEKGDSYPRAGYKPTTKRIDELSGSKNKRGKPLIKARENAAESVTEGIKEKPKRRKKN